MARDQTGFELVTVFVESSRHNGNWLNSRLIEGQQFAEGLVLVVGEVLGDLFDREHLTLNVYESHDVA